MNQRFRRIIKKYEQMPRKQQIWASLAIFFTLTAFGIMFFFQYQSATLLGTINNSSMSATEKMAICLLALAVFVVAIAASATMFFLANISFSSYLEQKILLLEKINLKTNVKVEEKN
jgi:protein-S-isoprenylcysteine O-methyltransferase Ste14